MAESMLSIEERIIKTATFQTFKFRLNVSKLKKYTYTEYDFEIKRKWGKDFYKLPQREQKRLFESIDWQKELPPEYKDSISGNIIDQFVDVVLVADDHEFDSRYGWSHRLEFKVPTSCGWDADSLHPRLYFNTYVFDKPLTGKPTFSEDSSSVIVSPNFHWDVCVDYATFKKIIRRYTDVSTKKVKDLLNSPYLK